MQLCALCRAKVHDMSYGGELVPESLNLYLVRPVRDKSHLQAILLDACAQSYREEGSIKDWRLRTSCIKPESWPPIAVMMQVPKKMMIIFNLKPVPNGWGFSISGRLGRVPAGHCSSPLEINHYSYSILINTHI